MRRFEYLKWLHNEDDPAAVEARAEMPFEEWKQALDEWFDLRRMMKGDMETEHREIQEAQTRFEKAQRALYTPDGRRKYSDVEHERRLQEAQQQLEADLAAVREKAEAIVEETAAVRPPRPEEPRWLDTESLTRANSLATFVREDVAELDAPALVERLQNVLRDGDTAEKWLHLRYGQQRWEEMEGEAQKTAPDDMRGRRALIHAKRPYREAIEALGAAIVPAEERQKVESARQRQEQAEELAKAAKQVDPAYKRELAIRFGLPEPAN